MCTRYVLLEKHYRAVLERLGIARPSQMTSRYNIAPSSLVPALRTPPGESKPEAVNLQWGLVPHWASSEAKKVVNARAESVAEKASFRNAFRQRRCVILASGFYEWQTIGRIKQPWLFRRTVDEPFGLAALWETWQQPDGNALETFAIITTGPNELMRPIHHRMPVVLTLAKLDEWLDPAHKEPEDLTRMLRPWPAADMTAVTVSRRMNNSRYDDPDCIEPIDAAAVRQQEEGPQLSLGL